MPLKGSSWHLDGVRNQVGLAQVLRERIAEAMLYRDLARLRTEADGVEIAQRKPAELEWLGAPRKRWEAFCDKWGLGRLRARPHRWVEG